MTGKADVTCDHERYHRCPLCRVFRYTIAFMHLSLGVSYVPSSASYVVQVTSFDALIDSITDVSQTSGYVLAATVCAPIVDAVAAASTVNGQLTSWPSTISTSTAGSLASMLQELLNRIRVQVRAALL